MNRRSGFRSVVVITSASHAEGRQFKSGRKHATRKSLLFLFVNFKISVSAVSKLTLEVE